VKVGDITLYGVEAVVLEGDGLKVALLGMSFLNRTEMKRDGQALTLIRRF
jgi:aspartyl protease family protein